jgi:tight adherence protein C
MSGIGIPILVFMAVFLGSVALMLLFSRSPDPVERRLSDLREGQTSPTVFDNQVTTDKPTAAADRLFLLDTDSFTRLRSKLTNAGFRGRHSVLWYTINRIALTGGLGLLGLQAQWTIELGGVAGILLVAGSAMIGFAMPAIVINHRITRRREAIRRALPNVLDLVIVCVEAGLSLNAAIKRIAAEMKSTYPELAEELNILNQEIFIGKSKGEAFRNLARRTGIDELRALATVLMQSDRMGTSIADVLRVQAETLRTKRRQWALETAHKMPVKLVFPLVLFIFPEILVVLLGPAGIQFYRTLVEIAR